MEKITIITPTYNRAHTLSRVYESLKRQTFRDFKWIIMDDGSTDNTEGLVKIFDCFGWNKKSRIQISYGCRFG